VTFLLAGEQAVVEVEDDLGLNSSDSPEIIKRLSSQGIRGIVKVTACGEA
jgi:hypothetical protein